MARNRSTNRRRRRGRFSFLMKLLCILLIAGAVVAALTVFFKVQSITVSGNARYTSEEIIAASSIEIEDNLFLLNKYSAAQAIFEKLPYVEEATINRALPDTIVITVRECAAAAGVAAMRAGATVITDTNMALAGIREMSTIEMPPQDRQPVQTYVVEHEWPVIAEAIRRELSRGGQVYYLHNRVENIESTAGRLRQWLGEDVAIGIAHGKMAERELSSVMQQMADGEIQVLVCTTIIETGIDIPNVNTLIIEDADRLGLSQLHQIRGRIGRSARRAYAYLTYRPGKVLTEVASKRLSAIREYVTFGSGFRIAMRDLEIRGAGNLLGPEQHGHMAAVGYDLYCKIVEGAVKEAKGEKEPVKIDTVVDIPVPASISTHYIPRESERLSMYKRIALIETRDDLYDVQDELIDRYGDIPEDTANLRYAAEGTG